MVFFERYLEAIEKQEPGGTPPSLLWLGYAWALHHATSNERCELQRRWKKLFDIEPLFLMHNPYALFNAEVQSVLHEQQALSIQKKHQDRFLEWFIPTITNGLSLPVSPSVPMAQHSPSQNCPWSAVGQAFAWVALVMPYYSRQALPKDVNPERFRTLIQSLHDHFNVNWDGPAPFHWVEGTSLNGSYGFSIKPFFSTSKNTGSACSFLQVIPSPLCELLPEIMQVSSINGWTDPRFRNSFGYGLSEISKYKNPEVRMQRWNVWKTHYEASRKTSVSSGYAKDDIENCLLQQLLEAAMKQMSGVRWEKDVEEQWRYWSDKGFFVSADLLDKALKAKNVDDRLLIWLCRQHSNHLKKTVKSVSSYYREADKSTKNQVLDMRKHASRSVSVWKAFNDCYPSSALSLYQQREDIKQQLLFQLVKVSENPNKASGSVVKCLLSEFAHLPQTSTVSCSKSQIREALHETLFTEKHNSTHEWAPWLPSLLLGYVASTGVLRFSKIPAVDRFACFKHLPLELLDTPEERGMAIIRMAELLAEMKNESIRTNLKPLDECAKVLQEKIKACWDLGVNEQFKIKNYIDATFDEGSHFHFIFRDILKYQLEMTLETALFVNPDLRPIALAREERKLLGIAKSVSSSDKEAKDNEKLFPRRNRLH